VLATGRWPLAAVTDPVTPLGGGAQKAAAQNRASWLVCCFKLCVAQLRYSISACCCAVASLPAYVSLASSKLLMQLVLMNLLLPSYLAMH
jgi:hypothetical protein